MADVIRALYDGELELAQAVSFTPLSTDDACALLQSDQRYRQIINSSAKP